MQRVKPLSLITLEIIASGMGAAVPFDMRPATGILVWRDAGNLAYWDGSEWVAVNSAGFASRFNTNVPILPLNSWAVISSPRLAVTGGQCFRRFKPSELLFAFHMISVEEFQPAAEKMGQLPDQQEEGRNDISSDVEAFIQEHAHGGTIPLKDREGR